MRARRVGRRDLPRLARRMQLLDTAVSTLATSTIRATFAIGVAAAVAIAFSGCDDGYPTGIEPGTWGGVGLILTVSADRSTAEFDCAIGAIDQPLNLTSPGVFAVPGTITLGHGGPVKEGEEPDSHVAVYRGAFDDDALRVTVTIPALETTTDTFILRKGDPGLLRRCL